MFLVIRFSSCHFFWLALFITPELAVFHLKILWSSHYNLHFLDKEFFPHSSETLSPAKNVKLRKFSLFFRVFSKSAESGMKPDVRHYRARTSCPSFCLHLRPFDWQWTTPPRFWFLICQTQDLSHARDDGPNFGQADRRILVISVLHAQKRVNSEKWWWNWKYRKRSLHAYCFHRVSKWKLTKAFLRRKLSD